MQRRACARPACPSVTEDGMEREERTTIAGDTPPVDVDHSGTPIIASAPASDSIVPAQLWRDYLSSWIGGSRGQFLASSMRCGSEAPSARAQCDALNHPQSGQATMNGGVNVTDCTTGGETCAPMS